MLKNLLRSIAALAIISVGVLYFTGCSKSSGKKVVIKGSTTVLPITQKAAEAYKKKQSDVSISIEGSGSGNGIKALLDSSCDIANSSRNIKDKEKAKAKEKGLEVKEITLAYDMIVPIVHPENPVKNLTMDQLKAIYDGSISNWKELGGKDENIVVISRDTSSGTYEVWHKKVMKKADVRKDALLQASNGAVLSSVAENSKAIGYVGYGYVNEQIQPLTVDNIKGTIENGKSGKFPISRALFMYVNSGKISPEANAFVDYLLSEEGQALVKEAGFIPL
jgi:phosphate transport system substrate-binding protein